MGPVLCMLINRLYTCMYREMAFQRKRGLPLAYFKPSENLIDRVDPGTSPQGGEVRCMTMTMRLLNLRMRGVISMNIWDLMSNEHQPPNEHALNTMTREWQRKYDWLTCTPVKGSGGACCSWNALLSVPKA